MPTSVELPDGSVAEFPDGMSQAQIQAAIEQHLGQPAPNMGGLAPASGTAVEPAGVLPTLARVPLGALSAAGKGLVTAAGIPGDIEALVHGVGSFATGQGFGSGAAMPTSFPTSPELLAHTHALGLTDNPALAAQNSPEAMIYSGIAGATSAAPLALAGPAAPIIASGFGGGLGAELGHELSPDSTLAPIAGSVLGGLGVGGLTSAAERATSAELSPVGQLFKQAGIPMRSAALTSEAAGTKAALGPYAPVAQTQQDLGNAIEASAAKFGPERTLQEAGQRAQDEARTWLANTMPAKEATAWAPVDAAIPKQTPTPLNGFEATLKRITTSAGGLQPLVDKLTPVLPKQLLKSLQNAPGQLTGSAPTWGEVRQLRSALGDAMRQPKIASDIGQDNLKALYASVTDDMRGAAKGVDAVNPGANALKSFDSANAESTRLNSFAQNVVGKIVHSKNPDQAVITPENAAKALLAPAGKGGTPLAALRAEMPGAADALAAYHLRKYGLGDAGAEDPMAAMDPKFPARWQSLSPEAKVALYPDPTERAALDARAKIGAIASQAGKSPTPVGWGHAMAGGQAGAAIGALTDYGLSLLAGHSPSAGSELAFGGAGELAGMMLPMVSQGVRGRLAVSPLLARYAASASPDFALGGPFANYGAGGIAGGAPNELAPGKRKIK